MPKCIKCQSENIDMNAEGVSRAGKPFSGPKCIDCGKWNFELAPDYKPRGGGSSSEALLILKEILRIVKTLETPNVNSVDKELSPDEEMPF